MKRILKTAIAATVIFTIIWLLAFVSLAQEHGYTLQVALLGLKHEAIAFALALALVAVISIFVKWIITE